VSSHRPGADSSAASPDTIDWLHGPHHDGSALYVEHGSPSLGDTVAVRLRVPHSVRADRVVLRSTPDAEPHLVDAIVDRVDDTDTWWVAELEVVNPVTNYRFVVEHDRAATTVNSAGTWPHDVTDAADFRLSIHAPPPAWLSDTVGYQIFPDRFAPSGTRHAAPDWATPVEWNTAPSAQGRTAVREWYGGDLGGIELHLDHLAQLGVNLIYLTPFFPGRSSHRYDATTFDRVDPVLGGDDALVSLTAAAHARGMRVIGDLTLNHTGSHHEWFTRAQADAASADAGCYLFRDHPDDYVAWYDLQHLPKLDHRSTELARRLFDGERSVVAKWLRPPFALDGWRVDCANTTARHGTVDVNATVSRAMRQTMAEHHLEPWLVAEHCYDATVDLDGSGWHGVMAYQWFTRPLAQWLGTANPLRMMSPRPIQPLDGTRAVRSMRSLAGGAPWPAIAASMTLLDSHDTPRFRTLVGDDRMAHLVAMAALMTWPGVPTVFAGSEIGVGGDAMDTARAPFPWDRERWDGEMLDGTRQLIATRRASHALRHGGLRFVRSDEHSITYLRESVAERVLVHVARTGSSEVRLDAPAMGTRSVTDLMPECSWRNGAIEVRDGAVHLPGGPGAWVVRLDR
jgi:alpha-glucosidase